MKHHISWTGYLEGLLFLLAIYYGYVFIRYYLPELKGRLMRKTNGDTAEDLLPPELLRCEQPAPQPMEDEERFEQQLHYRESQQIISEVDEFIGKVKQALDIAAKRPYSPDRTIKELREIVSFFPALKKSPYLAGVATVVAAKCEETGTATLTEEEVSQWWDDQ